MFTGCLVWIKTFVEGDVKEILMNKIIALKSTDKNISEIQLNSGKINLHKSVCEKILIENNDLNKDTRTVSDINIDKIQVYRKFLAENLVVKNDKVVNKSSNKDCNANENIDLVKLFIAHTRENPLFIHDDIVFLISKNLKDRKAMILQFMNNSINNWCDSFFNMCGRLEHAEFLSISFSAPDKELQLVLKIDLSESGSSKFYDAVIDKFQGLQEVYDDTPYDIYEKIDFISTSNTTETIELLINIFPFFSRVLCEHSFDSEINLTNEKCLSNLSSMRLDATCLFQFFGMEEEVFSFMFDPNKNIMQDSLYIPTLLKPVNDNMIRNYSLVFSDIDLRYANSKCILTSDINNSSFSEKVVSLQKNVNIKLPKLIKMIIAEKNNIPVLTDIDLSRLNDLQYMGSISNTVNASMVNNIHCFSNSNSLHESFLDDRIYFADLYTTLVDNKVEQVEYVEYVEYAELPPSEKSNDENKKFKCCRIM